MVWPSALVRRVTVRPGLGFVGPLMTQDGHSRISGRVGEGPRKRPLVNLQLAWRPYRPCGSSAWVTVGVSFQTKRSAKDYDAVKSEVAIQQLKSALGDLPFRTVTRPIT
jgi:hypothetical protein